MGREGLASDPRDKVYSILGMLTNRQRHEHDIVPSYAPSNTAADVYFSAVESILRRDADLRLLANLSGLEIEAGLPTWAPDWSQPRLNNAEDIYDFFEAVGPLPQVEVLKESRELRLHGFRADEIRWLNLSMMVVMQQILWQRGKPCL